MIATLALSAASFAFAAKKPQSTPAATDPSTSTTQTDDHGKKAKGKKHHKEHQAEQKPATK
jgi:hypothetical protein